MKEEILELAQRLIRVESVSTRPEKLKEVVDLAEDYLRKNTSLLISRFEREGKPSLTALFSKEKSVEVLLHAHLDVVPASSKLFRPRVAKNLLFGRGASDTKLNAAALLVLAKELSRDSRKYDLGFVFTTDEEIGGHNGAKLILEKGYRSKFFVTLESTNFDIKHLNKGIVWLKVTIKGKSAHSSQPWRGENAIVRAMKGLTSLYQVYPVPRRESWRTTLNVGRISGGDALNKVPDACEVYLDLRYTEEDSSDKVIARVRWSFPDSEVEVITREPMMKTDPKHPYVLKLAQVVKEVTARTPKIIRGHGGSDGRFFSAAGIPSVEFGTVSGGLHTEEEWANLDKLEDFYQILYEFAKTTLP